MGNTSDVQVYTVMHAKENTANQKPGKPLHILQYTMGNKQRVVFHITFPE